MWDFCHSSTPFHANVSKYKLNKKVFSGSINKSNEATAKLAGEQENRVSPLQFQERQQHSNYKGIERPIQGITTNI